MDIPFHEMAIELITPSMVIGHSVVELGSYSAEARFRRFMLERMATLYQGIDIIRCNHTCHNPEGKCVTSIYSAEYSSSFLGKNIEDIIAAFDLLQWVSDWRAVVNNMKAVVCPSGLVVIGTRTPVAIAEQSPDPSMDTVFPVYDRWRFTGDDLCSIFKDFEQVATHEKDGAVMLLARKPKHWQRVDLNGIHVASLLPDKPTAKPCSNC